MSPESINQFKVFAPLQLPELIDPSQLTSEEYTDDCAILTYDLAIPLDIEDVIELFDQQIELVTCYHIVRTDCTDFGHSCCAFSNPAFGHMYVLNAFTDASSKCTSIYATIFNSLEILKEHLSEELSMQAANGGHFAHRIKDTDLLIMFM